MTRPSASGGVEAVGDAAAVAVERREVVGGEQLADAEVAALAVAGPPAVPATSAPCSSTDTSQRRTKPDAARSSNGYVPAARSKAGANLAPVPDAAVGAVAELPRQLGVACVVRHERDAGERGG